MGDQPFFKNLSGRELILLFAVLFVGAIFIGFIRHETIRQEKEKALLIAKSVAASIPVEVIDTVPDQIEEIKKLSFPRLKSTLSQVIKQNSHARFAYLYIKRGEKLFFLVDSEPETSRDYSASGDEVSGAKSIDYQPFITGKAQITPPIEDPWGKWVTAEVPISDSTGKVIAVFGMDYDSRSWANRVWARSAESIVLVLLVVILFIAIIANKRKNKELEHEITLRKESEKKIRESENNYKLLFELSPEPIVICDSNSGKILKFNQATLQKYGYSESELLTMSENELKSKATKAAPKTAKLGSLTFGQIDEHQLNDGSTINVKIYSQEFEYKERKVKLLLLIDVSRSIRTELELIEKQNQLNNLLASLPGLVYRCTFDKLYSMIYISEGSQRITGYSPTHFMGQGSIDFESIILPEYREQIRAKWEESVQHKTFFEDIYPIQTATGDTKWVWERGRGVFGEEGELLYLEGYIEDYTDRKKAEQQLKKLSRAVEQNPASIVITDAEGNIEYVNPVFTEITGYEGSEVIGKNPRILKSEKMSDSIYKDLWETIISGGTWKGEIINKRKSGELYWDNKTISAIFDKKGQITNYVGVGEEITERKKIEHELIKAKERAEESDRLKSAFLANISHEIRTPMNGILGFADLLKSPSLSSELQIEFIEIIEKSGRRMLSIINDLIDISKIEAGETILRIKSVNVGQMLSEIQAFFAPEASQKKLTLEYRPKVEQELTVSTDGTKLNQVVTNLVKNSIKFTDEGKISFGCTQKNDRIEFFVQDTGIGISPEQKDLIFERFRQGSISPSRKHEGAGLGLAISKAYVEILGGVIWVESEPGKGSTFRFDLPLEHPQSSFDKNQL